MSQTKYCVKCGREVSANTKFCASCGTPIPTLSVTKTQAKRKSLFWVGVTALILMAFFGGASIAPERIVTVTKTTTLPPTATETKILITTVALDPTRLKIGQTFTFFCFYYNTPFEITFTELRYTDKIGYRTADKGYKFAVLYFSIKNPEGKAASIWSYGSWTAKVDKGYFYKSSGDELPYSFRPQETKTGYFRFEILQDTTIIEIRSSREVRTSADIILTP